MSSLKKSAALCAKVSVKVPRPDSLIEVRVTPPESDFEIKVLPGEEAIELTIRPGGQLIEVRIGPEGETAGRNLDGYDPVEDQETDETPAEEEVLPGVSRAEFEVMMEEDHGAEAKKLLAQMPEIDEDEDEEDEEDEEEEETPAEEKEEKDEAKIEEEEEITAETPPAEVEIIEEKEEITEDAPPDEGETDEGEPDEAEPGEEKKEETEAVTARPKDLPPELNPADPAFKLPAETIKFLIDEDDVPLDPVLTEALADPVRSFAENPEEKVSPAVGPAAREALARLSAAIGEERAALDNALEAQNKPAEPENKPAELEDKPAEPEEGTAEENQETNQETEETSENPPEENQIKKPAARPAKPDSTVMVELYDDGETSPAPEPAAPLSEEEQMDLGPVGEQEDELSLGTIDVDGLEGVDLDKSHSANPTTIKAKPLIKAVPAGTIVPA